MRPITNPIARFFLHLGLWLVVLYSIVPFIWTLLNSFKTKVDANARMPRIFPEVLWRPLKNITNTNSPAPKIFFEPTIAAYTKVLLKSVPENAALIGYGLIAIIVALVLIGIFAKRIPLPTKAIYWSIAGIIALILWTIPMVIDTAEIYDNFLNTVIVCVGTVIVSVSIGALSGYGLARYSGLAGVVILLAAITFRSLPRMGFILPYFQMGQKSGLYDSFFLVIIALVAVNQPFTMQMLRTFFLNIPADIEEAAMIDGASRFGAFMRVVVPTMWPGIVATSLFTLLVSYHEFILVRILTQTNQTLTVAMAQFIGGVSVPGSIPRQSAAAVVSALPLVLVVLIFQKQFVKGLSAGAVKG